jgi:hypothetical protein
MMRTVPELLWKFAATFIVAAGELWAGVPVGMALGLPPVLVAIACAAGGTSAAGLIVVVGRPVRTWIVARLHPSGRGGTLERIWVRYGVPGLGLAAPLLVGAPIGTAIGIALGAPPRHLFAWVTVGIVTWAVALTAAAALGWTAVADR